MRTVPLLAAVAALSACETMDAGMESGQDAAAGIAATSERFETAYNTGDAAAMAALYTPDGAVLPPDAARIDGREGIQAMWQSFMDAGVEDFELETVELNTHDDAASEVGRFTISVPDGEGGRATASGKYIVLWREGDDGVWRIHRDIWNDNPAG